MDVTLLNRLLGEGFSKHLAMEVASGEMTEQEALDERECDSRATDLRGMPPSEWPQIDVTWDTEPKNFHKSLDGEKPVKFSDRLSRLELVGVDIEELHEILVRHSQRTQGPFASQYLFQTAGIVAFLETGRGVTPPLIRCVENVTFIEGGNNRFALARYRRQGTIPILIERDERRALEERLPSLKAWP
ncbi:hypothetical protein [Rhizobium leguminosarum]|uniref:hypothetical protein n=1 Tax=Rhizobium leguminosarum TaxID=384 RepID=UPI00143F26CD|nr:hypothetical protein [Rhizobium leguminosarum]NKL23651.1 hypothetical protein [Rhizobium leguminosarum bv. viciae]